MHIRITLEFKKNIDAQVLLIFCQSSRCFSKEQSCLRTTRLCENLTIIQFGSGFPRGSEDKASACNAGDLGLIPWSGRLPGEENGNPLQYSCLENPINGLLYLFHIQCSHCIQFMPLSFSIFFFFFLMFFLETLSGVVGKLLYTYIKIICVTYF